jgi:hypothetical protein
MKKSWLLLILSFLIFPLVYLSQSQADTPNADCFNKAVTNIKAVEKSYGLFTQTSDSQIAKDLCGNQLATMHSQIDRPVISLSQLAKDYEIPINSNISKAAPVLHSNPTATRKLFLDVDGYTFPQSSSDSYWLVNNVFGSLVSPGGSLTGIDLDGDPTSFSELESAYITEVWQYVTENFSSLNIDVTTEYPGIAGLTKSNSSDVNFGVTAVVSSAANWSNACGCGGVAYLWSVNQMFSNANAQNPMGTSFNFNKFSTNSNNYVSAKDLSGIISHETGHNFGLQHDGTSTVEYYSGHSNRYWYPIMGSGYGVSIAQWSQNEYLDGRTRGTQAYIDNNGNYNLGSSDDFDIFQKNNIPFKSDDYGNSLASSTLINSSSGRVIMPGIIGPNGDKDYFKLILSTPQEITISAQPIANYPSLDILLKVYDSSGTLLLSDNPEMSRASDGKPLGMGASISRRSFAAGTYYLSVEGTGSGNPLNTGYSSYGSVGQYTFDLTVHFQAQATLSISNTTLTNAVGTPVTLTTAGGSGSGAVSYAVTGTNCTLNGATLGASAAASCVVTATKASDGTYSQAVTSPVTFSFLGAQAALSISNTTLTNSVGTSVTLSTTGGSGSGAITFALSTPNPSCSFARRGGGLTATAATTCSVVATKAAAGIYASITSDPVVFTFKGPQVTLSISNTTLTNAVGTSVTITTAGGSGTGAIAYAVTGANCVLTDGVLTATGPATCAVTAVKAEDNMYAESNTATKSFIFLADQAQLSITNNVLTNTTGTVVNLTSSGGSGTGATTYALSAANSLCSLVDATVTASQPTTCSVVATKAAQGLYASKTSAAVTFTFKGPQATLSISNTTLTNAVGTPVTLTTAGGSGSGAVSYAVTGTNCTLNGATLGASAAASCVVTATKASDGTYSQAVTSPVTFSFLGAQAALSISNTTLTNSVGTSVTLSTTGGSGSGAISYELSTPNSLCSISRRGILTAKAGTTCSVVARKASSEIYLAILSGVKNFIFG